MTVQSVRFGVGTFTLGTSPGTDYACQVQSMGLTPEVDEGDPVTVLCGDTIPGSVTFTETLGGTFLQDFSAAGGIVEYSRIHKGEVVDFTFVPSTAAGVGATGQVMVYPLAFGTSDGEFGDVLTADFTWPVVGDVDFAWPTA